MSDEALIERLCEVQHYAYEAAARKHNWSTQLKSRVPWEMVPEENKKTMRDSMVAVVEYLRLRVFLLSEDEFNSFAKAFTRKDQI